MSCNKTPEEQYDNIINPNPIIVSGNIYDSEEFNESRWYYSNRKYLDEFNAYSKAEILNHRKEKFLSIGKHKTFTVFSKNSEWIKKENILSSLKQIYVKFKKELIIITLLIFLGTLFLT